MERLIDQLQSEDLHLRHAALETLLEQTRKTKGALPVPNPLKFFGCLKDLLESDDWETVCQVLQLLQDLVPEFGPDIETSFSAVLPALVELLADQRPTVSRTSLAVLSLYVRTTRNLENVLAALIKNGLSNKDWRVRQHALQAVIVLLKLDLAYTTNHSEMRRLFEQVLVCARDTSIVVSAAAKEVAVVLSQAIDDFENSVLKKLNRGQQRLFNEGCLTSKPQAQPASFIAALDPTPFAFQSANLEQVASSISAVAKQNRDISKMTAQNGLVFGLLPPPLVKDMTESADWKVRLSAMQEFEDRVCRESGSPEVMPYSAIIVRFLCELLNDSHFKVNLCTLNILREVLMWPGVSRQSHLAALIPGCLEKLGNNNISIRQAAFRIFRILLADLKARVLMPPLVEGLSNSNWHIREEALHLLIVAMLTSYDNIEYEFGGLIPHFTRLLDDAKPKIRSVSIEALAVLANKIGAPRVLADLQSIVSDSLYKTISQRFKDPQLPALKDEFVEFPKSKLQTREEPAKEVRYSMNLAASTDDFERYRTTLTTDLHRKEEPSAALDRKQPSPIVERKKLESSPVVQRKKLTPSPNIDRKRPDPSMSMEKKKLIVATTSDLPSTEDSSASPQEDESFQFGKRSISVNESLSSTTSVITKRQFRGAKNSRRIIKEPKLASLKPPQMPVNISTKSGGSSKKVSYGYSKQKSPRREAHPLAKSVDTPLPKTSTAPELRTASEPTAYLSTAELDPIDLPNEAINEVLALMRSDNWAESFEGLNMVRRLLRHHIDVLDGPAILHTLNMETVRLADSLRSSLSKNALIVMGEIMAYLQPEADLEILVQCLLRKSIDTNVFIAEEAAKALVSMSDYCNENKTSSMLLSQAASTRSSVAKARIGVCFERIFCKSGPSVGRLKELGRMVQVLAEYITDASPDVRASARSALKKLQELIPSDFDRLLKRRLNEATIKRLKSMLDKDSTMLSPSTKRTLRSADVTSLGQSFTGRSKLSNDSRASGMRKSGSRFKLIDTKEPPEFEQLLTLSEEMNSQDWKSRYDTINRVTELTTQCMPALAASTKILTVVDIFSRALNDQNLKVNLHSLNCLIKVVPTMKTSLDSHLGLLMTALAGPLGSANSSVRDTASDVLSLLKEHCTATNIVHPLVQTIHNANNRAKPTLLYTLSEILEDVHAARPSLIKKHVVPLVIKLSEDANADIRSESQKLMRRLQEVVGELLTDYLPSKH
mmetsp:Transcript_34183/g.59789  ORF Transcript_34183/g.59789 Transcript_34183/m.59789 type:complete len:1228 (+) Transcript_34183:443-4126(+)